MATRRGLTTKQNRKGGDLGSALELVDRSRALLGAAGRSDDPSDQYIQAHLATMRAAAAVVAGRGGVTRRGSVWAALAAEAPELAQWAEYFEACARRRRRVEAALWRPTYHDSRGMLHHAETFLVLAQAALGVPGLSGVADVSGAPGVPGVPVAAVPAAGAPVSDNLAAVPATSPAVAA